MPIKFFEPINPNSKDELKILELEFNRFESTDTDSIGKVYVTAYNNYDSRPQIMLWCHYKSKSEVWKDKHEK